MSSDHPTADIVFAALPPGLIHPFELRAVSERGLNYMRKRYYIGRQPISGLMDSAVEEARMAGLIVDFSGYYANMPTRVM
jgi:hypothetical protein